MNKKTLLLIFLLGFILFPLRSFAATQNSNVGYDLTKYQCTSQYQDSVISTSGGAYFSHCMEAKCSNMKYNISYYSKNKVNCTNGNTDPYFTRYKNGCNTYETSICNENEIKYCSIIMYYDCSKKSDGSSFVTTTTTKTTTKKTTTSTTTTTKVEKSNTLLKSLTLSNGLVAFNSEIYEYNVNVDSTVSSIAVTAIPMDESSTVNVSGNTNIENGSVIKIIVAGTDGSSSEYKINVYKEERVVLSNNAKLKSLTVQNYNINFSSNINDYSLTIDESIKELSIDYEAEDKSSIVLINGNSNLSNNSKITISVTAQDGTVENYTITVYVKKKSNTIKILFIIILILAIVASGYYVYKKIFNKNEEDKYEYE